MLSATSMYTSSKNRSRRTRSTTISNPSWMLAASFTRFPSWPSITSSCYTTFSMTKKSLSTSTSRSTHHVSVPREPPRCKNWAPRFSSTRAGRFWTLLKRNSRTGPMMRESRTSKDGWRRQRRDRLRRALSRQNPSNTFDHQQYFIDRTHGDQESVLAAYY